MNLEPTLSMTTSLVSDDEDAPKSERQSRSGDFLTAKTAAIARFEHAYLSSLMKRCDGNLSEASRRGGIARHHLRELLRKHGLYRAISKSISP